MHRRRLTPAEKQHLLDNRRQILGLTLTYCIAQGVVLGAAFSTPWWARFAIMVVFGIVVGRPFLRRLQPAMVAPATHGGPDGGARPQG